MAGATISYDRGARRVAFHRCATCGVLIHWTRTGKIKDKTGVNMTNFASADIAVIAGVPVVSDDV